MSKQWREKNGVIYFSVTSDGTTGEGWIKRLESKGFDVSCWRELRSPDFKPTSGVTTKVAVLRRTLFESDASISSEEDASDSVRAVINKLRLSKPNPEVACLIREKFTDGDITALGLEVIIVMHEPIRECDCPSLLSVEIGNRLRDEFPACFYRGFSDGFAFMRRERKSRK
jgi:hypothetical protein